MLSIAHSYPVLLLGACLMGVGSSVFHPESSRVARMAAGGRHGLAQSLFQVGGNAGQALGPLAAALVVVRWGQSSLAAFALLALLSGADAVERRPLVQASWPGAAERGARTRRGARRAAAGAAALGGIAILLALIFSKYVYLASLTSYFTFYLIHRFQLSVHDGAASPVRLPGRRRGRARCWAARSATGSAASTVIWFSILGALPFTLLLPYASLFWTGPLTVIIGLILASAFPAIVVFAQELVPGKVGMISGLFFGFSFGMGGLGAAVLGWHGRHDRHRDRLPGLRLPAGDRPAGRAAAENRGAPVALKSAAAAGVSRTVSACPWAPGDGGRSSIRRPRASCRYCRSPTE